MTPRELLKRQPEKVLKINTETGVLNGFAYDYVPELTAALAASCLCFNDLKDSDRIEIRVYKDFWSDHRRFWRLASVFFDGKPVMIIQNAGREGDDHHQRYLLDFEAYGAMIAHALSLFPDHVSRTNDHIVTSIDGDIKGLTEFYGKELDGYFSKDW